MTKRSLLPALMGCLSLALLPSTPLYALSVVYPSTGHIHSSTCPVGDGSSHLTPDPISNASDFFLLSSISQDLKDELASGDTSFAGWTFDYTKFDSASGKLYIDTYNSVFYSNHRSGVDFHAHYVAGNKTELNLQWIQLVKPETPFDPDQRYNRTTALPTTNGPRPPANGNFIDPYPNDGTDGGPFYFNSTQIVTQLTTNTDGYRVLKFNDHPRRVHPPVSSNGMTFELYLVNLPNANEKTVEIIGGIQWGFHGECVPLPASVWMAASTLPTMLLILRRRKISRPIVA